MRKTPEKTVKKIGLTEFAKAMGKSRQGEACPKPLSRLESSRSFIMVNTSGKKGRKQSMHQSRLSPVSQKAGHAAFRAAFLRLEINRYRQSGAIKAPRPLKAMEAAIKRLAGRSRPFSLKYKARIISKICTPLSSG